MATITADSCSLADVNTAIAAASAGDTVSVPAGSAAWAGNLVITKGIYLIGAGIGHTVITSAWTGDANRLSTGNFLIAYRPTDYAANDPFRLSGFELDCGGTCMGVIISNPAPTPWTPITNIRVDHTKIYGAGNPTPRPFVIYGMVYGVADNNEWHGFYGSNDGRDLAWNTIGYTPGTANMFYYEDNDFYDTDGYMLMRSEMGSLWCARHNHWHATTMSGGLYSFLDMHGNTPSAHAATMGVEIYENTLDAGSQGVKAMDQRGGQLFMFNNTFNTTSSVILGLREEYLDSVGYGPANNLITGQPQHVSGTYIWNNLKNGTTRIDPYISETVDYGGAIGLVPQFNVDAWKHEAAFDGSSGIGVGLLSARPASCTLEGAAYWATDVLNDDGTYGRLYRATGATTWETYYTPYEYPHPLRAESGTGFSNQFTASIIVSASDVARLYVEYPHKRVVAGTAATYDIHVEAYGSFAANVTLDATGLPTNATDSYGTNPIAYTGTTTATISTTGVAAGTYSIYFTGTAAGGEVGSVRVILEVVASDDCAPKVPIRKIRVKQGESAVFTIQSNPTAGYTGNMDLTASGVPTGASGAFADATIAYNESTTYTVSAGTAAVGSHEITITGEGPE